MAASVKAMVRGSQKERNVLLQLFNQPRNGIYFILLPAEQARHGGSARG